MFSVLCSTLLTVILLSKIQAAPYILTFGNYAYISVCNLSDPNNFTAMSGYEPTLILDAMKIANLTYGVDIVFRCAPTNRSTPILGLNGTEPIIGSFGGIPIVRAVMKAGLSYSIPTRDSGLSIGYVMPNSSSFSKLYYFKAFDWELSIILFVIPLILGLVVYLFQQKDQSYLNYVHHFFMYFFKLDMLKNLKLESRLLELVFQVFMLVIMTLYTARLTGVLTEQQTFGVTSISDLRGLKIATGEKGEAIVQNLGARFVQLPNVDKVQTPQELAASLLNSNCSYFIMDTPLMVVVLQRLCNFYMVLKDVLKFEYAIVWRPIAPKAIRDKLNYGIIKALEAKSEFVRDAEAVAAFGYNFTCPSTADQKLNTSEVLMRLWVLWLACLGIATTASLISLFIKCKRKHIRTPFDLELRGKREDIIKNEISATFCGNAVISLNILREQRVFLLENSRYCSEKMNLRPEFQKQMKSLMAADEDITAFLSPPQRPDVSRIKRQKSKIKSFISTIIPTSPPRRSTINSPKIEINENNADFSSYLMNPAIKETDLFSNKKTAAKIAPMFKKEFINAAKSLSKGSVVRFSPQQVEKLSLLFATRQLQFLKEKEEIIKGFSSKFNLDHELMQQKFIHPKVEKSSVGLLRALSNSPSKNIRPKNKMLKGLLDAENTNSIMHPLQSFEPSDLEGMRSFQSIAFSFQADANQVEEFEKSDDNVEEPIEFSILPMTVCSKQKDHSTSKKGRGRIFARFNQLVKPANLKQIGKRK